MKKGKLVLVSIICSILVLSSLPIMSGCKAEEPSYLMGTVALDRPIAEATISIYNSQGKLLYEEKDETSSTGVFVLKITKPLPENFKIEATGGRNTANDEPFDGVLLLEIRNYDEQLYTSLYLGPISTLAASYMEKHSEMPYEDVQTKVLEFLNLESDIDIMRDMLTIKDSVYPAIFEAEAVKAGDFDGFITLLVDHIDVEGGKYSDIVAAPFGAGPVTLGMGGQVAKTLLVGLLEGVAAKAGGEAAGWVIDQIRGGDSSQSTKDELADMSSKLDEISSQITALDIKLTEGIDALKNQAECINYENASRGLQEPTSVIVTALGYLRNITRLDSSEPDFEESLQYYIDKIDSSKIEAALLQIHNVLVGQQGVRGITKIWGELELAQASSFKPPSSWKVDRYPSLESQFEYYAALQLAGLTVLIDKYHAESTTATVKKINAEEALNNYKNSIEAQGDLFLTSVEKILAWGTDCFHHGDHPIYQKEWSYKWKSSTACAVIGPVVESATLKKADTLVGDYMGLQNSITIRIYNPNRGNFKGDLHGYFMGMYLASGSKDGPSVTELCKPQIITETYPSQGDSTCMLGGPTGYTAQFARYRFDSLEQGVYYILDYNRNWRQISVCTNIRTGKYTYLKMINPKLFNLPFNVTSADPYHNQLIVGWLSETVHDRTNWQP